MVIVQSIEAQKFGKLFGNVLKCGLTISCFVTGHWCVIELLHHLFVNFKAAYGQCHYKLAMKSNRRIRNSQRIHFINLNDANI